MKIQDSHHSTFQNLLHQTVHNFYAKRLRIVNLPTTRQRFKNWLIIQFCSWEWWKAINKNQLLLLSLLTTTERESQARCFQPSHRKAAVISTWAISSHKIKIQSVVPTVKSTNSILQTSLSSSYILSCVKLQEGTKQYVGPAEARA